MMLGSNLVGGVTSNKWIDLAVCQGGMLARNDQESLIVVDVELLEEIDPDFIEFEDQGSWQSTACKLVALVSQPRLRCKALLDLFPRVGKNDPWDGIS